MPKRTPLVCQHLENISRDVLEQHQEIVRKYVRHRQGVYALYRRGKLYYVGLASNLRGRLAHHLKDRHHGSWARFSVYLSRNRCGVFLRRVSPGLPGCERLWQKRGCVINYATPNEDRSNQR